MRLFELLIKEYEFPDIKSSETKSQDYYDYDDPDAFLTNRGNNNDADTPNLGHKRIKKDPKVQSLGTGYFSSVYSHEDTPHDVVKFSRHGIEDDNETDGFQAFMLALAFNKDAQSNIYFPKFRSIRKIEHKGNTSFIARMEKLVRLMDLNIDELEAVCTRMFTEERADLIMSQETHYDRVRSLSRTVGEAVKHQYKREDIIDEEFIKAARWLQDLAKRRKIDIDLHFENMMIRRTPYGPQLVLSDPLGLSD